MPTKSSPAKKKRQPIAHVIDGIRYKTAEDIKRHIALKENPDVKSFILPDIKEKSTYSRYGAHKCMINDIVFDSVMEGMFYAYLLTVMRKKTPVRWSDNDTHDGRIIRSFERQSVYNLLPAFKHEASGKKVLKMDYKADFDITFTDGTQMTIDVKGKKTPEFRIKEKLFFYEYPEREFICVQFDKTANAWRNLDDIERDKRARSRARKKRAKAS